MYKIHAALVVFLAGLSAFFFIESRADDIPTNASFFLVQPPAPQYSLFDQITPIPQPILGDQKVSVLGDHTQKQLLAKAYQQAKADGQNPVIIQGILLQESKAGNSNYKVVGGPGAQFFGLMQVSKGTALEVLKAFPSLWDKYKFQTRSDDELKANLILNNDFNIEIGSKYVKLLNTRYGFTGRELANAYNQGPGGVKNVGDDFHYALGVESKVLEARRKGLL